MATGEPLKQFAEQALEVERLLEESGATGRLARVVYVLRAASHGVTQEEIVSGTGLRSDVVSKLLASLEHSHMLVRKRDSENARVKRLKLTDDGKDLLSKIAVAVGKPRRQQVSVSKPTSQSFDFTE